MAQQGELEEFIGGLDAHDNSRNHHMGRNHPAHTSSHASTLCSPPPATFCQNQSCAPLDCKISVYNLTAVVVPNRRHESQISTARTPVAHTGPWPITVEPLLRESSPICAAPQRRPCGTSISAYVFARQAGAIHTSGRHEIADSVAIPHVAAVFPKWVASRDPDALRNPRVR
jgi:hypothetical protein